jgi:hypothetical protein
MHRNCHVDRAFSLLTRRRLGRMNAADRPTKGLVDSQTSDVDLIPIARSINHDVPIGLTRLTDLNSPKKWTVVDPQWTPVCPIGPRFLMCACLLRSRRVHVGLKVTDGLVKTRLYVLRAERL